MKNNKTPQNKIKNTHLVLSDSLQRFMFATRICQIFSFFLFVTLFLALFIVPKNKNIDSKQTVLLAQKNIDYINTISFRGENNSVLVLKRTFINNTVTWIGNSVINSNSVVFPVDMNKITDFFNYMSRQRTVQSISEDFSKYSNYGLDTEYSFNITFSGVDTNENIRTFLDLDCGITDFSGQNIYFKTISSPAIYLTRYDFSSFCNSQITTWIDGQFLPNIVLGNRTTEQVQSITLINFENIKNEISSLDKNVIKTIFSMQSLTVASKNDLSDAILLYDVRVKFIDNTEVFFSVYKKEHLGSVLYFIQPDIFSIYSYALEISEWSVLRLKDLF